MRLDFGRDRDVVADPERQAFISNSGGKTSPSNSSIYSAASAATAIDDAPEEKHQKQYPQHETSCIPASTGFLDGLRGLGALAVFVQHYLGWFDRNEHDHGFGENGNYYFASLPIVRLAFSGGSAAVAIFFVLSGYVLSKGPLQILTGQKTTTSPPQQQQLHEKHRNDDPTSRAAAAGGTLRALASAVVRRPVRLYTPTIVVAFAKAILMHVPGRIFMLSGSPPKESLVAELANFFPETIWFFSPFRTHGSDQQWYSYNIVFWTIPVELKGSMLTFLLVALHAVVVGTGLPVRPAAAPVFTSVVLALVIVVLLQLGYWSMALFIAGFVLALVDIYALDETLLARMRVRQRTITILRHSALLIGLLLMSQPSHAGDISFSYNTPGWGFLTFLAPEYYYRSEHIYFRFWHSYGAILTVASVLRIRWAQRVLETRPLKYLGRVSFMFYLVHMLVLMAMGARVSTAVGNMWGPPKHWWDNTLWLPDWGPPGLGLRFLVAVAITLPQCLALSEFLTRVLDAPCVRLGKRLARRLGLEKPAAANAGDGSSSSPVLPLKER